MIDRQTDIFNTKYNYKKKRKKERVKYKIKFYFKFDFSMVQFRREHPTTYYIIAKYQEVIK